MNEQQGLYVAKNLLINKTEIVCIGWRTCLKDNRLSSRHQSGLYGTVSMDKSLLTSQLIKEFRDHEKKHSLVWGRSNFALEGLLSSRNSKTVEVECREIHGEKSLQISLTQDWVSSVPFCVYSLKHNANTGFRTVVSISRKTWTWHFTDDNAI